MTGLHQRAGLKHSAALTWLELAVIRDSRIPFLFPGQESFPKRGSFEVADLEANAARVGARSFGAARFRAHRNREDDSSLAARILSVLLCYTGFTYSGYFPK